jgi:hypothetical protein
MRLRGLISAAGLVLLFLATTGVRGCREEAARTFNPNRPPDTYLTAVPVESTTVSYLYHLYWSGTDPDGEVVGFFVAVTDSNVIPHPDSLVWTTRTDTAIAFKVAGTSQTLTHRFYATAVDNEGRADPSPAWVYFEAFDRYYPEPMFQESYGVGTFYGKQDTFWLDDTFALDGIRDTVPMGAEVKFKWTGRDRDRFGQVLGYRFRITGDAGFTDVGTNFTEISYRDLPSGVIKFSLVAVDDAGAQTDPESTRVFVSNFDPDTWYDPVFIEKRAGVEIQHEEFDTVAVGSTLYFTVYGSDGDGDDSKLQYSQKIVTNKSCGGGSSPAYSFFDPNQTGPVYKYSVKLSTDPKQNGYIRAWARCKDEYGRIDGRRAEFQFYSNLPPSVSPANVLVEGVRLDRSSSFSVADSLTVLVKAAADPDPGSGPGPEEIEVMSRLELVGGTYFDTTPYKVIGSDGARLVHHKIKSAGTYKLTITAKDYGCREGKVSKQIEITLR